MGAFFYGIFFTLKTTLDIWKMVLDVFSLSIFFTVAVIIGFIIKAIFTTRSIQEQGVQNYSVIKEHYAIENSKIKKNTEQLILVNRFQETIVLRLFEITKELLLAQKLIFDKQS